MPFSLERRKHEFILEVLNIASKQISGYEEITPDVLTGKYFMTGNVAAAEGAIAAGCRYFAGYPITPSSEIAERLSERLPQVNGIFLQMEDELASIVSVLGASWGGVKSMTATSGPGFSLMQETIGLAAMTETPCVIINVQRGGPSTGLPTLVSQGDIMQTRWGSHGDYEIIALSPNSPQECFNLTIECFNLSERYRVPVVLLMDESVGHMTERVIIPPKSKIKTVDRPKPKVPPERYLPYKPGRNLVPPMACASEGYFIHITGLTHDERGYPMIEADVQEKLVKRLCDKILKNADKIIKYEEHNLEDSDIVLISFGITSRSAKGAVRLAREKGINVGLLRLITIWPFPEKQIRSLAKQVDTLIVCEINNKQLYYEVERCAAGNAEVHHVGNPGGHVPTPYEILDKIEGLKKK